MNWKRNLMAFGALKFTMLLIAALLTALPVSASHAMSQKQMNEATMGQAHNHVTMIQVASANEKCKKHPVGNDGMPQHGASSCCQAFCATFDLTETITIAIPSFVRPTYLTPEKSAVLPGEYTTPHRPPNA